MPSKRDSKEKRAEPPRLTAYTRDFLKDWDRLTRSGRYDMQALKQGMMLLIANEGPMGPEWRDHALIGDWADHRECHIGGDFLLIYRLNEISRGSTITFVRAGTHAELFD